VAAARPNRRRLGDLLIEAGLLSDEQLKIALNEQRKWGGRLGRTVVELGFVTETAIGQVLAKQLELQSIDLDTAPLPENAASWLRIDLCERYGVFPVASSSQTRSISIATSDPTNLEHLQAIEFATNLKVAPVVATASAIERAIRKYYFGESSPSAPLPAAVAQPGPPTEVETSTNFELDELLGQEPRKSAEYPAIHIPINSAAPMSHALEVSLRREISVLREQVDALEEVNGSQVRALRVLLEVLIESGIVTRDEYLEKLHSSPE